MPPNEAELSAHLTRLLDIRLLDPLEILLESDTEVSALRTAVRSRAGEWAHRILAGDDSTALGVIMRLVATLYPDDGPFSPPTDWWRTPLGQALAWRVGHPTATSVSYAVAGAMLGITRQGVHDLVTRGKLTRHPDGGVTPASVRDRLRARDVGPTVPGAVPGRRDGRSHHD
ncbi:hypothetical protein [Micromonospora echinofusca]|uniref:hypothetical protein n=1 Tax=Micromonospora echinofusca TaxID=47858 RepID=UPI001AD61935|nr:hypothetical protein [Micromonospora echinofusca]